MSDESMLILTWIIKTKLTEVIEVGGPPGVQPRLLRPTQTAKQRFGLE